MIDYFGVALRQLGFSGEFMGTTYDSIIWGDEDVISEEILDAKIAELKVEWPAQEYARKRKAEYDALNQFELISDDANNGTTTHKDAVNAIKTKYPKP